MAKYYESQSSGRYSVDGDVTEWVKVPFNEARYGRDFCGSIICNNTWFLIRDAMAFWVRASSTPARRWPQIAGYLKTFDVQDRYDSDGDGNFDEPDGFIDHFQIVHAGGDQAAGDPQQGTDAIWSHRWYAQLTGGGPTPEVWPHGYPGVNAGAGAPSSGVASSRTTRRVSGSATTPSSPRTAASACSRTSSATTFGLPDLYDTSGNTGGAENSTGFWTLMCSGANIGDGGPNGIGDAPTDMGAWEKFQLGWLDCAGRPGAVLRGRPGRARSPSTRSARPTRATKQAQALFVVLPDKKVDTNVGSPFAGPYFYQLGMGNDLDNSMTRSVTLPRRRRSAHRPGALRDRDVLGLRVRGGLDATAARRSRRSRRSSSHDRRRRERQFNFEDHRHRRLSRRSRRLGPRRVPVTADLPACTADDPAPLPVPDRRRRSRRRVRGRRHRDRTGSPSTAPRPDRRLDVCRLHADDRRDHADVLQRLRRREPRLPRLRHVAARRPTTSGSSTPAPDKVESLSATRTGC